MSGGPPGKRNGQYRHCERTKGAIAEQQKFSALLKLYIYGYLNRVQSSRRRRVVQIPDVQADREYDFLALRFERAATPGCTLIHPRRTLRGAAT